MHRDSHAHRRAYTTTPNATPSGDREPRDRPPYAPLAAGRVIGVWYALIVVLAGELIAVLPYVAGASREQSVLPGVALTTAFVLVEAFGFRSGKLWAIRTLRVSSYAALAACFMMAIAAFYLRTSKGALQIDPLAPYLGNVIFLLSAVEAIGFFFLFRGLRRVRWLDPNSLPHEWEPPANLRRS